jgi:hypothetical protein
LVGFREAVGLAADFGVLAIVLAVIWVSPALLREMRHRRDDRQRREAITEALRFETQRYKEQELSIVEVIIDLMQDAIDSERFDSEEGSAALQAEVQEWIDRWKAAEEEHVRERRRLLRHEFERQDGDAGA